MGVMKLSPDEAKAKGTTLGAAAALMIVLGYPGELIVEGDLSERWMCWFLSMLPFIYIVYELLVGLAAATNSETDPKIKELVSRAQLVTVELVNLPSCVRLPNGWFVRYTGSRQHP